ncbi:MAG: hypothetical protein NT124_03430 [Candidatus Dependentiae bacterium]|nr:hypothetical protein [Candidatus Dependentiae bacterium]
MVPLVQKQVYKHLLIGYVLLLPGCVGHSKKKSECKAVGLQSEFDEHAKNALLSGMSKRRATSLLLSQEMGADFIDIPIPIHAHELKKKSLKNELDNTSDVQESLDRQLSYKSSQNRGEIVDFYLSNMERFGWSLSHDVYAHEVLLFFVKPDKRSVISIRPYKKSIHVFIFISDRML